VFAVQTMMQHVASDCARRADDDATCYLGLCSPCRRWCNMLPRTVFVVQTMMQHVTSDCVRRAGNKPTCYLKFKLSPVSWALWGFIRIAYCGPISRMYSDCKKWNDSILRIFFQGNRSRKKKSSLFSG